MKVLILNGSPRKGNTVTAINAFVKGAEAKHEIEVVDTYKLNVAPCKGCDACECTKGCIDKDDTNSIADKIVAADFVVFATPVYWWGVTAQMKLVIDKLYCRGSILKGKHIGAIVIGAAETSDTQYRIIREQFECIAEFLSWNIHFYLPYSASAKTDLAENADALAELEKCGAQL